MKGVRLPKSTLFLIAALVSSLALPAAAQTSSPADDMKRLAFLNGSWTCTIHGGPSNGVVDHLTYSFTADNRWLIERSDIQTNGATASTVQVWGYDPSLRHLVAHEFSPQGVFTKTVNGWQNGQFVSTRDDNGATVTLVPHGTTGFDWIAKSQNAGSPLVTESCAR